jgi:hypothetical protein
MHLRFVEAKVDTPLLSFLHQLTLASLLIPYSDSSVDKPYHPSQPSPTSRTPAKRRMAKVGVMGLDGWPSLLLPPISGYLSIDTIDLHFSEAKSLDIGNRRIFDVTTTRSK